MQVGDGVSFVMPCHAKVGRGKTVHGGGNGSRESPRSLFLGYKRPEIPGRSLDARQACPVAATVVATGWKHTQ